ncbi:MAG: hypothetical protein FJ403_21340 [Verrucomicrobia bacterium]|nr:hypothetical protein [Verrucomicrobiota bacterium]
MTNKTLLRFAFVPTLLLASYLLWPLVRAAQGEGDTLPPILQAGLSAYASGGPEAAIVAWRKGGPLESDRKALEHADDFKEMQRTFGHYRSHELIETKDVSKASKIVFLAMNFERGAAYASFLTYKTSKDWVVQDMDFSTKPETIMPWLALGAGKQIAL